ncbi:MAG: hypothetical protein KF699_07815 [Phycisphaeraceae bacterium]|nr:hypothetical protein [Phycisphaeraceae bacterium]MBX3405259.1 hypothetical protein [Phycisphaeraceae bacterium]
MKVKCLSLALAAGLVCGSTAMADPVGKAGGAGVVARPIHGNGVAPIQQVPKDMPVGRATYHVATGEVTITQPLTAPEGASDVNVRGPGPTIIWDAGVSSGFFFNHLSPANPGGANTHLSELFDWGVLCGEVGVDVHTVNQFVVYYVTDTLDAPGMGFSLTLYWDFDPTCPADPDGTVAGFACLANQGVIFDLVGLPGSATQGTLAGWIVTIDLTGGGEELIPAGEFAYSMSEYVGFQTRTGPFLAVEDQIAAPGTDNFFDWYAALPQTGSFAPPGQAYWFGGSPYAQFRFQLYAEASCPNPTVGACCDTDTQTCTLTLPENCTGANQNFLGLGIACSPVICLPVPANDLCANAQTITGFGQFAYDNRNAGEDGPADCTAQYPADTARVSRDVWFRWTAPCTGTMQVTTCGFNLTDDKAVIYVGNNCNDLSNIAACDDDGCGIVGGAVDMTFSATAGQVYLIRMGLYPAPNVGGENFFEIINVDNCTPVASCPADWDGNTQVEVADIFAFLGSWFAGDPAAQNFGGTPGVPAIFAFLGAWFAHGVGPC